MRVTHIQVSLISVVRVPNGMDRLVAAMVTYQWGKCPQFQFPHHPHHEKVKSKSYVSKSTALS